MVSISFCQNAIFTPSGQGAAYYHRSQSPKTEIRPAFWPAFWPVLALHALLTGGFPAF